MVAGRLVAIWIGFATALAFAGACSSKGTGGSGGAGTGGAPTTVTATQSSTSGVVTGTGGSGGGPGSNLANNCMTDADCGGGLTCITDAASDPVFGGGPAGGYCSLACMSDNDCPGSSSACLLPASGPGLCVLTCTIGPALMYLNDALDPNKCWGRNDLRCGPINASETGCLPTCGEDSQCPMGRVCDPRLTVCVGTPSMGKAAGSVCDPMAMAPECAGVCVNFTGGQAACSEPCVLGGNPSDPTDTPNCGGVMTGLCVYSPMGNGAGDYGFCAPACTQQDQCQYPAFWCLDVGGLTGMGVQNGYCLGAVACPNGASDCAMSMGTTCTDTVSGPFCLPAGFPLGAAGPADGGSDASDGSAGAGTGGAGTGGAGTGGAGTGGAKGTGGSDAG